MMRFFTLLTLFSLYSYAIIPIETIKTWYENGEYSKVCSQEVTTIYEHYHDNEEFVNMYGHSCVETDMISRTVNPINKLIRSPQTRANSVYFATVLYQKKLLYHALVDNVDISYVRLPRTKHILSTIFDLYVTQNYEKNGDEVIFKDEEFIYRVNVVKSYVDFYKLIIKTFQEDKLIKTRAFW